MSRWPCVRRWARCRLTKQRVVAQASRCAVSFLIAAYFPPSCTAQLDFGKPTAKLKALPTQPQFSCLEGLRGSWLVSCSFSTTLDSLSHFAFSHQIKGYEHKSLFSLLFLIGVLVPCTCSGSVLNISLHHSTYQPPPPINSNASTYQPPLI